MKRDKPVARGDPSRGWGASPEGLSLTQDPNEADRAGNRVYQQLHTAVTTGLSISPSQSWVSTQPYLLPNPGEKQRPWPELK